MKRYQVKKEGKKGDKNIASEDSDLLRDFRGHNMCK
jgi:hypothetical protein